MVDYEKVPLTKAETLAMMGIPVWYERRAPGVVGVVAGVVESPVDDLRAEAPSPDPAAADAAPADAAKAALPEPSASGSAPAMPTPPAAESAAPAASAEIIEFTWVKGASGLVVHTLCSDAATLTLLKDIVRFGDWTRKMETGSGNDRGDFRWPQLVDTSGSPLRAFLSTRPTCSSGCWVGPTWLCA